PLVAGIGHETDVTIADFAADLRAATPTAAAELASPDRMDLLHRVRLLAGRLEETQQRWLANQRQRLDTLARRLDRAQPRHHLRDRAQRLDNLDQRLRRAMRGRLDQKRLRLAGLTGQLDARTPTIRLRVARQRLNEWEQRLLGAMCRRVREPV
ncbi:exodeoxyribonuclease VII large subunit, partial [Arthrospira platensis SPKY1]|nr:exodeoxyribonuclease VII large subunit [Arthrospira platensis SPKY1]